MSEKPVRFVIPLSFAQRGLERLYPNLQITELVPIKTGFANSIFAFKKDGAAFILRMPPTITSSLVRESELMKALFHERIPVPQVIEYDPTYQNPLGHPFMIMEKVEGITLTDVLENLNRRQTDHLLREIAEALNRIHRVDTASLKVIEFITLKSFIDSKLAAIEHLATLSRSKIFNVLERWIQENRPGETTYNKAFIHNDFHQYNIMVGGGRLTGILDWVDATVGEAQVDVALFSLLAEAAGYPEVAETFVTAYRQVSNLPLEELKFYVTLLAIQKFLQIPLQAKQMEETGQVEKAELMISLQSRLEKNFIKIIEENTDLSLNDFQ